MGGERLIFDQLSADALTPPLRVGVLAGPERFAARKNGAPDVAACNQEGR